MTAEIHLTVNGREVSLPVIPGESLSDLLRKRLHLTGTKVGCGEGKCGACTVLVNGRATRSCTYPAERADGKTIRTIEDLAVPGGTGGVVKLHPLQEAFVIHGAVQCGFCTPGQIMSAAALLEKNANPTSQDIRQALKSNLCRCAAYPSIENAVMAAAQAINTGQPVNAPVVQPSSQEMRVIGTSVIRPDAVDKVTGNAIYTDDLQFEGMLFARVKRAGVPHAFLRSLDISKARDLPGVVAVLTAGDIPGQHNHGLVIPDWPTMVGMGERIRYEGDAIAILAAETQQIADAAVALIEMKVEPLPIISDPVQALHEDVPSLHLNGNLLKHIKVRKGDVEKGFAEADFILEHIFHTPIMDHLFMEPECSVAVPTPDGRMLIHVGSQIPYSDRQQVADALGWLEERVHIAGTLMGGGFGGKEDITGQIHAALLANATDRPVKLLFDRRESMLVHPKRHATQICVKIGARKNGRLTAVQTELYGDTGAYASLGEKVMTRATTHSAGPYDIPHTRADCYAMYTNNPPAGAFRGFGVTQSAFAIETMMDMVAKELEQDPISLRHINALQVGSLTNTGQLLHESVGLIECIDSVQAMLAKLAGPDPFKPVRVDTEAGPRITAWGFAVAFKNTGLGGGAPDKSGADVQLYPDGTLEVRSSAAELGQGLVTVLRMIVAEEFGVAPQKVRVLVMDTDLTPDGGPTTASRQTFVTGNAARYAAIALRQAVIGFLSEHYEQLPENVRFTETGIQVGEAELGFGEVASQMIATGQKPVASYEYSAPETRPLGQGGDMHFAFSFAAQAAQVEVDPASGNVRVLKVISANDVGRAINPLGLKGQVEGGIIMGLGHALMEEFVVQEGHIVTDRLSRYPVPGIKDTPEIISIIVEAPTAEGPYGAKGVGEIVSIPTPPAITNAIYNAIGLRVDRLPVRKAEILGFLESQHVTSRTQP
jgi:selenium-dependent xanthine dehydrogenase